MVMPPATLRHVHARPRALLEDRLFDHAARDNAWRRGSRDAAGAARRSPSEDGRSRRAMGRERRRSRMQKRRANGQANALPWAILALTRQCSDGANVRGGSSKIVAGSAGGDTPGGAILLRTLSRPARFHAELRAGERSNLHMGMLGGDCEPRGTSLESGDGFPGDQLVRERRKRVLLHLAGRARRHARHDRRYAAAACRARADRARTPSAPPRRRPSPASSRRRR